MKKSYIYLVFSIVVIIGAYLLRVEDIHRSDFPDKIIALFAHIVALGTSILAVILATLADKKVLNHVLKMVRIVPAVVRRVCAIFTMGIVVYTLIHFHLYANVNNVSDGSVTLFTYRAFFIGSMFNVLAQILLIIFHFFIFRKKQSLLF